MKILMYIILGLFLFSCENKTEGTMDRIKANTQWERLFLKQSDSVAKKDSTNYKYVGNGEDSIVQEQKLVKPFSEEREW